MSKHTLKRVVDYADGWLPFGFDIDRLERSLAALHSCAEEKGRFHRSARRAGR